MRNKLTKAMEPAISENRSQLGISFPPRPRRRIFDVAATLQSSSHPWQQRLQPG